MRKLLLIVLFINIFFTLTTPAYSAEWLQIENSLNGEKNYIDLASVRYKKHIVTFLSKNIDKKAETTKISYSINCINKTGAIRDIIIYSSNGTVLKSYSYKKGNLIWGEITPYSFMNSFKKLLCKD